MLYNAVCYKKACVLPNSVRTHYAQDLLQQLSITFGAGWQHACHGANTAQYD